MTTIIFGINGQDGYYLKSILKADKHLVIGVSRSPEGDWIKGDIANYLFVEDIIKRYKPDYVFHLAANSTIQHYALFENHETVSTGSLNILESVRLHCPKAKVFLSGSAMQFKNDGLPIDEKTPFEANNPYSVARIQSVYAGRYYRSLGLNVYIGYFFHHDSPLRSDRHLNMHIIKTALKMKNGAKDILEIGNPDIVKEFNHAYDMMSAIWCLTKQEEVFEAVIGSGIGYSINNWIDICFNIIGLDRHKHMRLKSNYVADFSSLVSSPRIIKSMGWVPTYDIQSLANDMIDNG